MVKRKDATSGIANGLALNLTDALPGSWFIGFTGTPLQLADANTRTVFRD